MWKSYGQRELIGLKNTIRKCAFSFFFFVIRLPKLKIWPKLGAQIKM